MESRERHLHELYGATLECPNITDATLLCKIWLHQRQLDEVNDIPYMVIKHIDSCTGIWLLIRFPLWNVNDLSVTTKQDKSIYE